MYRVIITLYNLGLSGAQIDQCFRDARRNPTRNGNADYLTEFRGRQALIININESLTLNDMFNQNIGPASSIGNPSRDPTLRAVILTSFPGELFPWVFFFLEVVGVFFVELYMYVARCYIVAL